MNQEKISKVLLEMVEKYPEHEKYYHDYLIIKIASKLLTTGIAREELLGLTVTREINEVLSVFKWLLGEEIFKKYNLKLEAKKDGYLWLTD